MSLTAPANPTKTKHIVYLIATTVLGVLLSLIAHAVIESVYLQWAEGAGVTVTWYRGCALHPVIQVGLLAVGTVGGFFLGRFWWRMVYIERRWAKGKRDIG